MSRRLTTTGFIERAKQLHCNLFSYENTRYVTSKEKVIITCKKHSNFEQWPQDHLRGTGCPKCKNELLGNLKRHDNKSFVKAARKVHNDFYVYSNIVYTGVKSKLRILCPTHGEFIQIANDHLNGSGCSKCKSSSGERAIRQKLLSNNSVSFKEQYRFSNCRLQKPLSFDFGIFDRKNKLIGLIEYNGEQHYKSIPHFRGQQDLPVRKKRDKIKQQYCEQYKIPLLVIPFWHKKKIFELVDKFIAQIK